VAGGVVVCEDEHPSATHRRRVAVCAEDVLARNGIVAMLAGSAEFDVSPGHRDTDTDTDADVVVVVRPGAEIVDALRALTERTRPRFVAVSQDHRAIDLVTAGGLGLRAVVPVRDISPALLHRAVLTACTGGVQLPADSQASLLAQMIRIDRELLEPHGLSLHGLDSREVELVRLLAAGWDLKDIADKLSYSERTVKNVLHSLTGRLGMRNRTQVVAYAIRTGAI
jgi:DNA-binding NarL/FixJ family response regulator